MGRWTDKVMRRHQKFWVAVERSVEDEVRSSEYVYTNVYGERWYARLDSERKELVIATDDPIAEDVFSSKGLHEWVAQGEPGEAPVLVPDLVTPFIMDDREKVWLHTTIIAASERL